MRTKMLWMLPIIVFLTGCNFSSSNENTNNSEGSDTSSETTHTHDWNVAKYSWSSDYSKCTAERTCKIDSTHKEIETVTVLERIISLR